MDSVLQLANIVLDIAQLLIDDGEFANAHFIVSFLCQWCMSRVDNRTARCLAIAILQQHYHDNDQSAYRSPWPRSQQLFRHG
jgi:hypothetical protein